MRLGKSSAALPALSSNPAQQRVGTMAELDLLHKVLRDLSTASAAQGLRTIGSVSLGGLVWPPAQRPALLCLCCT